MQITESWKMLIVLAVYLALMGCSEESSQGESTNISDTNDTNDTNSPADTVVEDSSTQGDSQDSSDIEGDSPPLCGNSVVEQDEECDDGNDLNNDACIDCVTARCGDGIIRQNVETCDDANNAAQDGCSDQCRIEVGFDCQNEPSVCATFCGDGTVAGLEACDDANTADNDYCASDCSQITGRCGDNIVQGNEGCDDGNQLPADGCAPNCTFSGSCGDNIRQSSETCDDGNQDDGDYCAADCSAVTGRCGDGIAQTNEQCDDGNTIIGDYCSNGCVATGACGDGVIQIPAGEVCDDGNTSSGDGCLGSCASLEPGWNCTTTSPTSCVPVLCTVNQFVEDNTCVNCPPETINPAGDDASGPDTSCEDDPCYPILGVVCADFEQAYIKASNTGVNHYFGWSIALDGDTLVVGALNESSNATGIDGDQADTSAPDSGAVYVFTRSGTTWTQTAYIKASNTNTFDSFGRSVALSGDTLAVGAPYESSSATGINGNQADNSALESGAVYVFTRSGTTWTQQAYIKASNTDDFDNFGASVSLNGDTLAVGAHNESSNATGIDGNQADNSASESGAVYVFTRSGTTWTQQAYVKASNTGVNNNFGWSIALDGDTLAVGANQESSSATGIDGNQADTSAPGSGAVYVFTRSGTAWTQTTYIKASNTGASDYFGWSLALEGDTLAVGALNEASNATGINGDQADDSVFGGGAVYVFTRSGTIWTQQAYIKASNTDASDYFGNSVALDGDTLVIGAPYEFSNATGINGNQASNSAGASGAVYVFARSGTTWTQMAYIKASNTDAFDLFGASVSLSVDTLAVGAYQEDSAATGINGDQTDNSIQDSGAVYIRKIKP